MQSTGHQQAGDGLYCKYLSFCMELAEEFVLLGSPVSGFPPRGPVSPSFFSGGHRFQLLASWPRAAHFGLLLALFLVVDNAILETIIKLFVKLVGLTRKVGMQQQRNMGAMFREHYIPSFHPSDFHPETVR